MVARVPAALVVMLSLAAPPLVGIVCGLMCDTGHHHAPPAAQYAEAPAHHGHTGHGGAPALRLVGEHVCDHGLGVVDVYGPSNGPRAPLLPMTATLVSAPDLSAPDLVTAVPGRQPLERVLGPPTRSLVLRV